MMKILIATGNAHKLKELLKILPAKTNSGQEIKYLSFADFPDISQPEETGQTFQENALIKARAGFNDTNLITIADDSGLMANALGGRPGIHSARYAYADKADHDANNRKLLQELKNVQQKNRIARFCTIAALILPDGKEIIKEGFIEGFIAQDYSGQNGFGYDPLFVVKELNKTIAELSLEEKNKVSHRAKAFAQIAQIIKSL